MIAAITLQLAAGQHMLPCGFQKVRHYGFASPNSKTSFEAVRWMVHVHYELAFLLLAATSPVPPTPRMRCADCGGALAVLGFLPPKDRLSFDTS